MAIQNITFNHNVQTGKWQADVPGQSCTFRIDFDRAEWIEVVYMRGNMQIHHCYVSCQHTHRFEAKASTDETIRIVCYSQPVSAVLMEPTEGASQQTSQTIAQNRQELDEITGVNDTTPDVDTMPEIKAFLSGYSNDKTLSGVIEDAQPEEMTEEEAQAIKNLIK